jgi:hypothetical protein
MKDLGTNQMQRYWIVTGLLLCVVLVFSSGCSPNANSGGNAVSFTTPYQAVLLSNGSVYYGKLSGYGTASPVLTDVFYILGKSDPETKQVSNVLVKRGKELHGPDRMYLNATHIVFVEPVGPDSKVAQLINETSK